MYDWLVGCNGNTAIAFDHATDSVELILTDVGTSVELVFQDDLDTRQWGIATALTQPIDRHMEAAGATIYGSQRVRNGQVVVVVGMEVEVGIRIALHHLAHIVDNLQRVHDTQRVGEHEAAYACVNQRIH